MNLLNWRKITMTQRIFKKSCKQDMVDLFNILPDWVNYVTGDIDLKTEFIYFEKQLSYYH